MKDCVFLLADGTMEAVFQRFLSRSGCHLSLGTRALNFDPREDIIVNGTKDPGIYTKAHELLRPAFLLLCEGLRRCFPAGGLI